MATIWQNEEINLLTKIVFHYTKKGIPMDDAFIRASKKLSIKFDIVKSYWYTNLHKLYKKEIKAIRKQIGVCHSSDGAWTKDQEKMVIKCVLYCIRKDKGIGEAFFIASKKLGRTRKACAGRWYEKLAKNQSVMAMVERAKEGIREEV